MYEPVKFKHLRELAAELNEKIEALSQGNLSADDLESMTDQSRELYERLVVLRFKAYDNRVKDKQETIREEEAEAPVPPSITFRIDEPRTEPLINQVSLIDAIEEVTREVKPVEQVQPEIQQIVVPVSDIVEIEKKEPGPVIAEIPALQHEPAKPLNYESLHERLAKGINPQETLAQRLEHNPIPDLKKAISLNQRFQFSKELFKGNNQDYEVAIDKLNTVGREEAMKHLDNLRSKYSWNNESAVTSDFVNLVERRHQH